MDGHDLVGLAAPTTLKIVAALDDLDAPTPCAGWDVRTLVNHLLHWAPVLTAAATKSAEDPGPETDRVTGEWRQALTAAVEGLAAAWSDPAAWQGTTGMGGGMDLPADLVGGMVLGELVLHGWDLSRAAGVDVSWDERVLQRVHDEVARTGEQGRAMEVYAAEVPVPPSAPLLARTLALSGRTPA